MRRAIQFLAVLLVGLGLLTFVGYTTLQRTTQRWFEKDLALRSSLAVAAARQSLAGHWDNDGKTLSAALADIARDERIMSAAACSLSGERVAATDAHPQELSCRSVMERMREEVPEGTKSWSMGLELPSGRAQLSVSIIEGRHEPLGAVVLVHDLSYLARREATTRNLVIAAFFILSLAASIITLIAARLAWRGWTLELRRSLSGNATKDFAPLVRDVQALANQIGHERAHEARAGAWSPDRLRAALTQYLNGERIVILANREPYMHERSPEGVRVIHPASGLVTALEPVMRACSGVWVAHGSGSADRDTVDPNDRVLVPPGEESYQLRRVWLSEEEENGYYYGFSNEGLWPLCHVAHTRRAISPKP